MSNQLAAREATPFTSCTGMARQTGAHGHAEQCVSIVAIVTPVSPFCALRSSGSCLFSELLLA
jgi:hypothetical protein